MSESVLERVRAAGLVSASDCVLALVSGGRDSVCLLDVLASICGRERVRVLHVDYGLRGVESTADAAAVRELCATFDVPCTVAPAPSPPQRGNLQAWARDLRYALALGHSEGALIATGHTASDEAETVLHRLASSPGRRALLGIAPRDGRLVRPLLGLTREQTAAHCRERGLAWREDSSNAGVRFARGRIRHRVVPELERVHPAAQANLLRTVEILRAEADVLEEVVSVALAGRARIALERLARLPPALARLVVMRLAEDTAGAAVPGVGARVPELLALGARGGSATLDVGGGVRALVEYGVLRFARADGGPAPCETKLALPGTAAFGAWELRSALAPAAPRGWDAPAGAAGAAAVLDAGRVGEGALSVRAWRAGDRMRPLGLAGSRAVSDLFTDRRVPRAQRATMPLVWCGAELAWIPGVAVADRFRVDGSTQRVVVLHAQRR